MRWIVRILSGLLMLVAVLVGLVFLIPSEKVAGIAAAQFAKATGRALVLDGAVKPTVWPVLGVKTGPVRISNAGWSEAGPMLVAEGLAIGVDMVALLGGDIRITQVEALAPQILLEVNAAGVGNWVFERDIAAAGGGDGGGAADAPVAAARPVTLDYGIMRGGALRFVDHRSGFRVALTEIDAEVRLPDYAGPAALSLAARKDGKPLLLDAEIAGFAAFLGGDVTGLRLAGGIGTSAVKFDGRMGVAPLMAEGDLTADLQDMGAVMALAGLPAPDLPQGLGRSVRKLSGRVTLTAEGSLHLRGGVLGLDGNRIEGDGDLTFDGGKPNLKASLKAGALDFGQAVVAGAGGGAAAGAPQGGGAVDQGWSRTPIDVSALGALDAAVSLSAESIDLGRVKFGASRLIISLVKSRAVFEAREMEAYGGAVAGNFVVNGRGGLSVGGDLTLRDLSLQPLLQDVAGFDRLIGRGNFAVKFLGVGNSMAAIANSLSGDGSLSLGQGELRGLDLVGMLRRLDPSYVGEGQKTIFSAVGGRFSMRDGNLYTDDMAMDAPYLSAGASGRVGIGARDLDLRVVPTALQKEDGSGGIRVPLKITGPWADPKYEIDLKALADQEFAEEKARLKEKAKAEEARAKAKLEKELGIAREEGESLEDAAKRRAQEALEAEARRALGKLFGGN